MSKIKLAVLFGGASSEHEISLVSASSVIPHIPRDKYEVICVGITRKGRWLYYPGDVAEILSGEWEHHPDCTPAILSPDPMHGGLVKVLSDGQISFLRIDCVFPILHGRNGEDGTLQGLLELSQIPYVGCDTLSSAACMDKAITHTILDQNGIATAKWSQVHRRDIDRLDDECQRLVQELGFPMFVKPANAGSSVGISKAKDIDELSHAIKTAFSHDNKVVVEQAVKGQEIECAVMGNDFPLASIAGEIVPRNEFYDYEAKYVLDNTELLIPANISDTCLERLRATAVRAYQALCCSGLARVDFFVTADEEIIVNEINTLPGFTSISMYPKLFEASNVPFETLLDTLISLALEKNAN